MRIMILINDPPYGTEKAYNALRLGRTLQKENNGIEINIFLMADAVVCALPNQKTPQGYYNIERMLKSVINNGAEVKNCGACIDARGIDEYTLLEGVSRGTMVELSKWVVSADKVLTF